MRLRALVQQPPELYGVARSRWRLADLRIVVPELAHYSLAGLSRVLRRLGIRRKRGRLSLHSPDLAYASKLAWIARATALAEAQPDAVRLLYGDECSFYRQPTLAQTYAAVGEEPTAALAYHANHPTRLSGALDRQSGQVTWTAGSRMGVVGLCAFLRAVRRAYPQQRLFLVWDNWPVHRHPAVLTEAAVQGIELLWLPTYAPWTNPIEKLWRWLKQTLGHHHRLANRWEELQRQIAAFLDRFESGSPELLRYVGLLPD